MKHTIHPLSPAASTDFGQYFKYTLQAWQTQNGDSFRLWQSLVGAIGLGPLSLLAFNSA